MGGQDARPVVLLADDDGAITSNLAPFLDRAGFCVHIASDGEAALALVERLDPDACILDVLMPGADGREVLRRLRAAGRWLPVVLLTQVGESGERAIALDEGADDYLNKPFDPYELGLLREVTEAVGEIPGASGRVIRVTVPQAPWPLPLIEGDRDLLFIAIQNLVANAVKFSAPGDTIEVRASEDGDGLLLEVADTGADIPADEIGQVWHELARGRAARSLPGTGIGLALVRVITARHGGRVAIRSREGQGTVVSLRLPAPDRARAAPVVAALRQHRDTPGITAV